MCKDDKSKIAEMLRAIDKKKLDPQYSDPVDRLYQKGLEDAMQIIMRLRG
tara:strand:+ start:267 stop:416 length:150 start_codon:yes stop_codon:yes gene_type:complete